MRRLVFLLIGAVIVAASAFGVRHYGVDVMALTGMGPGAKAVSTAPAAPTAGGARPNRGPAAVETARASASRLSDDIQAIGTLLADESVAIAPETSGRIARIAFQDGASVSAGTPLFQLDPDLAKAELDDARARLKLAEANFARNQKLRQSGNVAQSAFEESQSARDVAQVAVDTAQVRLSKLTITAPFSGTLGFRTISEGAYVTAGTPLVQLDKVDRLQVSFAVPELQQQALEAARSVEFTADALPGQSFNATISALNPAIDVNGRALQVRAQFENTDMKLRPGLLVRVTVKGPEREAVVIPEAAVVQRGDKVVVFTVADNKATEVAVKLGKRMEGKVEVRQGLTAGDTVVTAGNAQLSNGAAVDIVSAAAAAG